MINGGMPAGSKLVLVQVECSLCPRPQSTRSFYKRRFQSISIKCSVLCRRNTLKGRYSSGFCSPLVYIDLVVRHLRSHRRVRPWKMLLSVGELNMTRVSCGHCGHMKDALGAPSGVWDHCSVGRKTPTPDTAAVSCDPNVCTYTSQFETSATVPV